MIDVILKLWNAATANPLRRLAGAVVLAASIVIIGLAVAWVLHAVDAPEVTIENVAQ